MKKITSSKLFYFLFFISLIFLCTNCSNNKNEDATIENPSSLPTTAPTSSSATSTTTTTQDSTAPNIHAVPHGIKSLPYEM